MKAKIKDPCKQFIKEYPVLVKHKSSELVVMLTEQNRGFVVVPYGVFLIGDYMETSYSPLNVDNENWEVFKGVVELSNSERE